MKAIRIKSSGEAVVASDARIPDLRPDYILVKTAAVALNPTDWKHIDFLGSPGAIVGCDYSGVVTRVGDNVKNGIRVGDRVAGMVHGSNASHHEDGAFAEYVTAKGDLQIRIPDAVTFETAATLGAGLITAGQSLYQSLGLPLPESPPRKTGTPVLIYSGSTATGTLAIQLAKLSGCVVLTTCSAPHEKWLRELGADHVFDYKSPTCAADIRKATYNKLSHAWDPIFTSASVAICCEAIGDQGGTYTSLEPVSALPRSDIVNKSTVAFTAIGEPFQIGGNDVPARTEDFKFAVGYMKVVEKLLAERKLKPHPLSRQPGGLGGILEGLDKLREGDVSGAKLVYSIGSSSA